MGGSLRDVGARAGWTEVVRGQAPVLHAVGYALTGSPADAEVLLEAGLAAAAARWDPEEPGDAHDTRWLLTESVRALLRAFERGDGRRRELGSRLVVSQPPAAGVDPDLEERLPAWRRLQALAPEHRATLVVRHLPVVAGRVDPARVLGVRRRDLPERERRAAAAFGEGLADLPAALAAVTGQLPAVVVEADAAARLGRPHRRRRQVWSAAGAAGLLALAVGLGVAVVTAEPPGPPRPPGLDLQPLTPARGPAELADLPVGGPTDLPYWSGGILHAGGGSYRTTVPRTLRWAGGTTLVSGPGRHQVVTSDSVAGLPGGITSVQLAPDGRLVAWVAGQEVAASVVEDDGTLGPPLTFDAAVLAGPADVVRIQSILTDGRIVVQVAELPVGDRVGTGSPGRAVVWTPGGDPVEVRLPAGVLLGFDDVPWPGGISWLDPGSGIVLSRVRDDGSVRPVGHLDYGGGVWSADGRVVAQIYASVPYVLAPFDGGFAPTQLPLPPPRTRSWRAIGWENSSTVVVAVDGPDLLGRTLVRCAVPSLVCERVGGGPDGRAVLPG